ncbi:MAG: hypothetical protein JO031_15255, partial [Ktedonobacteraceae bacterium]|nr:hypothetical protein [Ktedonobacteraceae bacterium]
GALFPQPYILTPEGKRVLLDEALGNHFALIRLYEGHDPFNGLKHPLWSRLQVRFIAVKSPSSSLPAIDNLQHTAIIDIDQQIANFLHQRHDLYILIRPDRYVMGACRIKQIQQLENALQQAII